MAFDLVTYLVPLAGVFALVFVGLFVWWLNKQDAGTSRMKEIASWIQEGANAFLRREFQTIGYFIVALTVLLLIVMWPKWQIALGFVVGAGFSMLSIYIGMNAATRANVRATSAARSSAAQALLIAFRGGE